MNDCHKIREQLDDWLDELLDTARHERVEAHLKTCEECREVFQRYRTLSEDLLRLSGTADRIAAMPGAAKIVKPRWTFLLRTAAAMMLLFTAGYVATRYRHVHQDQISMQPDITVCPEVDAEPRRNEFYLADSNSRMPVRIKSNNPRVHIVWLYGNTPSTSSQDSENGNKIH
ncbi:MAG: zf-HC2 domain-containing protein [Phycisphaerales bacterium]|nr:zf-HC2 domain-containing protein [Phycisphaerales bacterium]